MSDFKKKRQEAMSAGFKREYGPSMGARVDTAPCSLCGRTSVHTHKTGAVIENGMVFYDDISNVRFISASMVPAPECDTCKDPMKYTGRGTDWSCENNDCSDRGNVVNPGFGGVVERIPPVG
ncbi:hypothetical protein N9917_01170 [Deltaproteobacteria bacterium]|nr:hypothetical protein [Deltaproteobacteria bacterium]